MSTPTLKHPSANDHQVGGDHYKATTGNCASCGASVQHWDLFGTLPYLVGCATKYILRHRDKGNGLQDLLKAKHYIDKIIEQEYTKPQMALRFEIDTKDFVKHIDKAMASLDSVPSLMVEWYSARGMEAEAAKLQAMLDGLAAIPPGATYSTGPAMQGATGTVQPAAPGQGDAGRIPSASEGRGHAGDAVKDALRGAGLEPVADLDAHAFEGAAWRTAMEAAARKYPHTSACLANNTDECSCTAYEARIAFVEAERYAQRTHVELTPWQRRHPEDPNPTLSDSYLREHPDHPDAQQRAGQQASHAEEKEV